MFKKLRLFLSLYNLVIFIKFRKFKIFFLNLEKLRFFYKYRNLKIFFAGPRFLVGSWADSKFLVG